jgi:predicted 3-demethylubiquinone-9 3-methyltransferase (glyoxalase superfamily)
MANRSQQEIDRYAGRLAVGGDPAAQQCGWLQDRYGVAWQVVPAQLGELLSRSDPDKARHVMQALLQMKKIDIEALRTAAA